MSESTTWNASTSQNTITVGNTTVTREGELDAETVRDVAADNGVKNFKLEDEEGNGLDPEDFPYDGDVTVKEYNENA